MSLITQILGFVLVSLVIINGLLAGAVVDAVGTFATEEESAQARTDLSCGVGYMLYKPVTDIGGINVPMPSYTNVFIAASLTLGIIVFIKVATAIKWNFKKSLIAFVLVWISIKVLGYALMMYGGNECITWAESMFDKTGGFYDVAAAGGSLYFLKIAWGMRK